MTKRIWLLMLIAAAIFTACTEKISDAGDILIPPQDNFDIKKFDSDSGAIFFESSSFNEKIDLGASERVLLGKFENIKSTTLLKMFVFLPDSLKSSVLNGGVTVIDNWIELPVNYVIGDTNSVLNFTVHKINNYWLPADYDVDSLAALQYDAENIGIIRENSDTLISFSVTSAMALDWMKNRVDDKAADNYGVVLIPDDADAKMIGFQGLSSSAEFEEPVMRIVYSSNGGGPDTITAKSTGDVHVLTGTSEMTVPDRIYLQSNFALRGKFFLDHKIFPEDAVINKATITFFIDTVNTIYGNDISDSLMAQAFEDSASLKISRNFRTHYLTKRGNTYVGDITTSIQLWINGVDNQGFLLRLSDEYRSLNKVVLYGSNSSLKPRLIVYYMDKN